MTAKIKWKPAQKYYAESICGRYTLCKIYLNGQLYFEAWDRKKRLGMDQDKLKAMRLFE